MTTELRPDIEAAAESLAPGTRLLVRRSLKKLADHLHAEEQVEAMVQGEYEKRRGLLILTSERLLFIADHLGSSKSEDFPLSKVSSIEYDGGLLGGAIKIRASGASAEVDHIYGTFGQPFVGMARERLAAANSVTPVPASTPDGDIMAALSRLGQLHDAGVLTDAEFEGKKADLLARL